VRRRNKISDLPHLKFVCGRLAAFFLFFTSCCDAIEKVVGCACDGVKSGWGWGALGVTIADNKMSGNVRGIGVSKLETKTFYSHLNVLECTIFNKGTYASEPI